MKTIMGWIDKIVSSLARRKVNKDEGRPQLAADHRGPDRSGHRSDRCPDRAQCRRTPVRTTRARGRTGR